MKTGVIAAVSDFSIPIDRVVGTSSGALAAALFANGLDAFDIATGEARCVTLSPSLQQPPVGTHLTIARTPPLTHP